MGVLGNLFKRKETVKSRLEKYENTESAVNMLRHRAYFYNSEGTSWGYLDETHFHLRAFRDFKISDKVIENKSSIFIITKGNQGFTLLFIYPTLTADGGEMIVVEDSDIEELLYKNVDVVEGPATLQKGSVAFDSLFKVVADRLKCVSEIKVDSSIKCYHDYKVEGSKGTADIIDGVPTVEGTYTFRCKNCNSTLELEWNNFYKLYKDLCDIVVKNKYKAPSYENLIEFSVSSPGNVVRSTFVGAAAGIIFTLCKYSGIDLKSIDNYYVISKINLDDLELKRLEFYEDIDKVISSFEFLTPIKVK